MIKLEHTVLPSSDQMRFVIEGMRNPMNSWDIGDSDICDDCCSDCGAEYQECEGYPNFIEDFRVGEADYELMKRLAKAGTDHRKFMRMMPVYVRITAPLYWWKEADTYKVGTVTNSCSTMHKIQEKEFTLEDFSCEHLVEVTVSHDIEMTGSKAERLREERGIEVPIAIAMCDMQPIDILQLTIDAMNTYRGLYLKTNDKTWWWQMIQLLPSSYNQTRNVMLNYEVLTNMYHSRKNHKLDEWKDFCKWIENLPCAKLIIGE